MGVIKTAHGGGGGKWVLRSWLLHVVDTCRNVGVSSEFGKVTLNCNSYLCLLNSYIMEKVDLVIVGAEGVVENGGIINKVKRIGKLLFSNAFIEYFSCLLNSFNLTFLPLFKKRCKLSWSLFFKEKVGAKIF